MGHKKKDCVELIQNIIDTIEEDEKEKGWGDHHPLWVFLYQALQMTATMLLGLMFSKKTLQAMAEEAERQEHEREIAEYKAKMN